MGTEVVAAIDCGTNSTRLIVVDAAGTVLERRMVITRLGEGVDATRRLAPAAIDRTLDALAGFRAVMDRHGVRRGRLAATSAARDAVNAGSFLSGAEQATGITPEILSGSEEGRLSFLGATRSLPPGLAGELGVLVVDIGGGSTELALGRPDRPDEASAVSVEVGCVRVTERFLAHDPPLADELDAARRAVSGAAADAAEALGVSNPPGALIGLAGTVSTLAMLDGDLDTYSRRSVHHRRISAAAVRRWCATLAAESATQRRRRPAVEPGRADVIVGGVLVLDVVMERFSTPWCLASEDDILDGLAASVLARP